MAMNIYVCMQQLGDDAKGPERGILPVEAVAGVHVGHAIVHQLLEALHPELAASKCSDGRAARDGLGERAQHGGSRHHLKALNLTDGCLINEAGRGRTCRL